MLIHYSIITFILFDLRIVPLTVGIAGILICLAALKTKEVRTTDIINRLMPNLLVRMNEPMQIC